MTHTAPPRSASPSALVRTSASRRSTTFVVAGILLVALVAVTSLLPVPYVAQSPGPTEDTLGSPDGVPVLRIEGQETFPTTGELRLTTVAFTPANRGLDLIGAVRAWLDPQRDVVPRRLIYPEGTTPEQVDEENAELMSRSQEAAQVAGLRQAGFTVDEAVVVEAIQEGSPALGRLEAGDRIVAVDGEPVATAEEVGTAVRAHAPGESVRFDLRRDGDPVTTDVVTEAREVEGVERAVVGITPAVGYELPFEVDITLGDEIGGPSAGLVFALGIYDKLTEGDLLDDRVVAGTGEITAAGDVGAIGGAAQKVAGAEDAGAEVLLLPEGNCADVKGIETDLRIVPVATLAAAVDALEALGAGRTDLPTCA